MENCFHLLLSLKPPFSGSHDTNLFYFHGWELKPGEDGVLCSFQSLTAWG
jgi:hypothetical protein